MAERVNEGVLSLSDRLLNRYGATPGIVVDAYSTRRVDYQTGENDILTNIRLAQDPESTRRSSLGDLLYGLTLLPRDGSTYEEGRSHEVNSNERTIVSVQVFSKAEDIPVINS